MILTSFSFAFTLSLFFSHISFINCLPENNTLILTVKRTKENERQFEFIYALPVSAPSSKLPPPSSSSSSSFPFDLQDIYRQIDSYCQAWLWYLPKNCKQLLLAELFTTIAKSMKYSSPWLINDIAKNSFTAEIIQVICDEKSSYLKKFHNNVQECHQQIENDVRIKKVWISLFQVLPLRDAMLKDTLIELKNWDDVIEGHSFAFYDKIKTLSKIADNPKVSTICEIGYNFGHSTLNWLNSNPTATIIAFDVVRYLYTTASLNSVYNLFPNRDILLIAGDSKRTVPLSASSLKSKCNVIFIDGGHTYDVALADILNMKELANETYHTVIIDDGRDEEVRRAALDAISRGVFKATKEVVTNQTLCLRSHQVASGSDKGKDVVYREPNCDIRSDYIQDSLIIGKYIF